MTRKNLNEYLIYKLSDEMKSCTRMDAELFKKLDVKRGLRNEDGTGVLVGLTNIGNVVGYERLDDGSIQPVEGRLYFRGYEVKDLVHAIMKEKRFGYEEICFLLLSGRLPDAEELQAFQDLIFDNMPLEQKTILHIIELEGDDIMNILARSVLEFYTFDENPDDVSPSNSYRSSRRPSPMPSTCTATAITAVRCTSGMRSLAFPWRRTSFTCSRAMTSPSSTPVRLTCC